MNSRAVVVVGETASLGRSIGDLLLAEGIPCHLVTDLSDRELKSWGTGPSPVIVVACNEPYCRTARRWSRGELPGTKLVVVGARDPVVRAVPGAQVVPLPLARESLLALIRELISDDPHDLR
ncbi:MAG: hypothetical protein WB873_02475 [Thermoplasmata archaeon]